MAVALGHAERVHVAARAVEEGLVGVAKDVEEGVEGAAGATGEVWSCGVL